LPLIRSLGFVVFNPPISKEKGKKEKEKKKKKKERKGKERKRKIKRSEWV
jgi:hypothetical protein